jgi:diadenosine tetraphosphate (Ap4A) HIT family hydrolase
MCAAYCDLCNEFSLRGESTFGAIYAEPSISRIIYRSSEFVVIPSLGQILEGHVLMLPQRHFTALGDMSDVSLSECRALSRRVRATLEAEYGSCIFFEHGTRCVGAGGCGVTHAHLHGVPLPQTLDPVEFLTSSFPSDELRDLTDIREKGAGLTSYLFYEDSQERSYLLQSGALPSQYMRKLLAQRLGSRDWDWRNVGREGRLLATIEKLAGKLEIEGRAVR